MAALGPRRRRPALVRRISAWAEHQQEAALATLTHLAGAPLATLMTVAAIAIALALPATLFVVLKNFESLGGDWERTAAVSLFLQQDVNEDDGERLAAELRARPDIAAVELISRERGLAEFREYSGLGGALDHLSDNPLPVVLSVYPALGAQTPAGMRGLLDELESLPRADFARLDTEWAQRFHAIVALLRKAVILLAAALGLAVLLVIGNTIRLEIENRRTEVQIMDLVGATPGFIRRPFIYSGAWYGLLGGMLAWAIVGGAVLLLQGPVGQLASLYHADFRLRGLGLSSSAILLSGSVGMGILGSWIAVGRHLSHVDPA